MTRSTHIGYKAGRFNGSNDTCTLGYFTLYGNNCANAVAIGRSAAQNASATGHISIGWQAGNSQTSGGNNTNLGYEAGFSNTTGAFRTMVGYQAGKSQTGGANTFIGSLAGGSRSGSGTQNVAIGNNALRYLENADNTAIGSAAGQYADSTSSKNVIIGSQAMSGAFGSKSQNVVIGYQAGNAMTTGGDNTLMGCQAGDALTAGQLNTVVGSGALGNTTSAYGFVAIGKDALGSSTSNGSYNTAVGTGALGVASGGNNIAIGGYTAAGGVGGGISTGSNNTVVGTYAANDFNYTGSNNTIIGYDAEGSSASVSNEITLGNSSVTALRCAVTSITSLSDERDKSEIEDLSYGLAFIDALQPREFVWDNRAETRVEIDKEGNNVETEFYSANKGKKDFGFIAQEVKELDNDTLRLVYDENPDKLELSYGKLVPILVKAIQELKEEVEILKSQNN